MATWRRTASLTPTKQSVICFHWVRVFLSLVLFLINHCLSLSLRPHTATFLLTAWVVLVAYFMYWNSELIDSRQNYQQNRATSMETELFFYIWQPKTGKRPRYWSHWTTTRGRDILGNMWIFQKKYLWNILSIIPSFVLLLYIFFLNRNTVSYCIFSSCIFEMVFVTAKLLLLLFSYYTFEDFLKKKSLR